MCFYWVAIRKDSIGKLGFSPFALKLNLEGNFTAITRYYKSPLESSITAKVLFVIGNCWLLPVANVRKQKLVTKAHTE